ncbi:MAG: carotenoid biosynthesis protein, partial [Chloroflexota bacterium]
GIIAYGVKLFSDASNLPDWARPVLDGLLALNIDLAMDAVAIRLGMWDWGQGFKTQYFGVPYANFWAWFWVVASFSAGIRWLIPRVKGIGRWLSPFGALLIGTLSVLGTNALIVYVIPHQFY